MVKKCLVFCFLISSYNVLLANESERIGILNPKNMGNWDLTDVENAPKSSSFENALKAVNEKKTTSNLKIKKIKPAKLKNSPSKKQLISSKKDNNPIKKKINKTLKDKKILQKPGIISTIAINERKGPLHTNSEKIVTKPNDFQKSISPQKREGDKMESLDFRLIVLLLVLSILLIVFLKYKELKSKNQKLERDREFLRNQIVKYENTIRTRENSLKEALLKMEMLQKEKDMARLEGFKDGLNEINNKNPNSENQEKILNIEKTVQHLSDEISNLHKKIVREILNNHLIPVDAERAYKEFGEKSEKGKEKIAQDLITEITRDLYPNTKSPIYLIDGDNSEDSSDFDAEPDFGVLMNEIDRLKAENESIKSGRSINLPLKVSQKGALSVYGLQKYPVTLYKDQWLKLIGDSMSKAIKDFINKNDHLLLGK
jgi:hypothetical protein